MVVREDDGGGVEAQRGLHHFAGIDRGLRQRAPEQLDVLDDAVLRVKEDRGEHFMLQGTEAQREIGVGVGRRRNQAVAHHLLVKDGQRGLDDVLGGRQLELAVVVDGEKVDVRSGHLSDSRKWAGLPTSSGSVRSAAVKGETAIGRKRPPGRAALDGENELTPFEVTGNPYPLHTTDPFVQLSSFRARKLTSGEAQDAAGRRRRRVRRQRSGHRGGRR
ncbi:protein of unknown function (plasmid) [Denitratisoma oestradiolicum]|uniref:Uncharacterized protein n=1 Tax=Denitratisoma oestradiolicum TaxID=311182 RepID=A0A6S6Y1E6_9PROT|nr:protein of unknown function [Denitratisoma oestradiolicum]